MHVLLIANELAYFRAHREGLMHSLLERGAKVTVACGGASAQHKPKRPLDWPDAVTFVPLALERHRLSPLGDASLVAQFARLVRRLRPDVVHTVTIKPAVLMALVMQMMGGNHRPALVMTLPGLGKVFEASATLGNGLRRFLVARVLRRAVAIGRTYITVENPADRQRLAGFTQLAIEKIVAVAGTGLDRAVFNPDGRVQRKEGAALRVLMASRLIGEKGVDTYLTAAQRCALGGLNLNFSIAGNVDPNNADALSPEIMAELETGDPVAWLGSVAMSDMPALLRRTDIVCLPTRLQEGFPRALLEAAACGCVMIASDQPAVRQIVRDGETGFLLNPPDADALVSALTELDARPEKVDVMGGQASALVKKMPVGEDEVASAFLDIYQLAGAGAL